MNARRLEPFFFFCAPLSIGSLSFSFSFSFVRRCVAGCAPFVSLCVRKFLRVDDFVLDFNIELEHRKVGINHFSTHKSQLR